MASTVLPNGIIIPEKYSRDWYNDLYHNWQELDNLLGGGTPKDGTLTIQKNGTTVGTFSANQATDETIDITVPDVNNGTLTIQQNGTTVDTFTANSSTDKTVNISVPTKTSDLTNDSNFVPSTDLANVATSGNYNDLSNKPTIPTVNNGTLTIQQNGTTVDTFTANSSSDKTVNIQCVDLTNNQTVAGNKEFTGTTTAHDLVPSATDTYNCGTSTNKWKSINGINPGALSLPSTAIGSVDIKSTVGQYLKDNNTNIYEFTAPFDGWVSVGIVRGSLRIDNITTSVSCGSETTGYWHSYTIPFMKNNSIEIKINKMDPADDYVNDIMWKAYIYPCQGNV